MPCCIAMWLSIALYDVRPVTPMSCSTIVFSLDATVATVTHDPSVTKLHSLDTRESCMQRVPADFALM
jgi:hypothetical protein